MRNHDYKLIRPGDLCDCGEQAEFYQSGYKICGQCRQMQMAASAMEAKRMTAGKRDTERSTMRLWKEFNPLEHIFTPQVLELSGGGLLVRGHGEYLLKVA